MKDLKLTKEILETLIEQMQKVMAESGEEEEKVDVEDSVQNAVDEVNKNLKVDPDEDEDEDEEDDDDVEEIEEEPEEIRENGIRVVTPEEIMKMIHRKPAGKITGIGVDILETVPSKKGKMPLMLGKKNKRRGKK